MKYDQLEYEYIDTPEALQTFCDLLSSRTYIAIDTEFLREKTYWPELCLVQIKSGEHLACIDALALEDLSALSQLLQNQNITKVLHSASQDMEIFYWLEKKATGPVFDTQIAAPLLGHTEQIGYGNLVKEALNVNLAKAHTRADWTRRPLPEKQLHYALDDVIYLERLYLKMHEQLQSRNRLHWLDAEFAEIADPAKYNKPAADMWRKMRAAQNLKGASLAAMQSLAEWRELRARESNRPRTWIIKDDVLTDLARQLPDSIKELEHIRGLNSSTRQKHGKELIELLDKARTSTPESLPAFEKKKKLNAHSQSVLELLVALVSVEATKHEINASQLAPRKLLEACVTSGNTAPLKGWRYSLIGEQIEQLLAGELVLGVESGKVVSRSL